jgi:hypothetical protein
VYRGERISGAVNGIERSSWVPRRRTELEYSFSVGGTWGGGRAGTIAAMGAARRGCGIWVELCADYCVEGGVGLL